MQHRPALTDVTPTTIEGVDVEHRFVDVGDVTLHVAIAGPADGHPLILLHGFPEAWFGWKHQIPALAAAGFRVVAPDQRGYNLSEKPAGIGGYTVEHPLEHGRSAPRVRDDRPVGGALRRRAGASV